MLDDLGAQVMGLVEDPEGVGGVGEDRGRARCERREDEVVVGDDERRLPRFLARRVERAGREVGTAVAGATLAVCDQGSPDVVWDRLRELVSVAVPFAGL